VKGPHLEGEASEDGFGDPHRVGMMDRMKPMFVELRLRVKELSCLPGIDTSNSPTCCLSRRWSCLPSGSCSAPSDNP
jgi:hypothetical protein